MAIYKIIKPIEELYNNADGNDDILSDIGTTAEVRMGHTITPDNTVNEFGGDSLYSHDDSIGDDEFPAYNNADSSPSIENNLNANSAMYNEDLEYNHVSDATQDTYVIGEEFLGTDKRFEDEFEIFKNPKSIKNLRKDIKGIIDMKTGDFYVANYNMMLHIDLARWLNVKLGFNIPEKWNDLYDGTTYLAVQRRKDSNIFGLSEVYTYEDYNMDDYEIERIISAFEKANQKNPTIEFSLEGIERKTKPEPVDALDERVLSSMAGSSSVEVKQKCRLAGNGNTSTPCNQGDIGNLNIKPLKEAYVNLPYNKTYWGWVSPENQFTQVPELKHAAFIEKRYPDMWDTDKIFDKAFADGWVRVIYEYYPNRYKGTLSLNGGDEERVLHVLKNIFLDSIRWSNTTIYLQFENPNTSRVFNTGDSEGKAELANYLGGLNEINEESLGVIDYEDVELNNPIEMFKNPKSLRNLKPSIRGIIDAETGDLYAANTSNYFHNMLIKWLNQNVGTHYTDNYNLIYKSPDELIPVQRDQNTNVFKLGEMYPTNLDKEMEGRREMLAKIKNGLALAKQKNPSIEFIPQTIDSIEMHEQLNEEIDASEAYRDEDGLQTILDGKRNVGGYVTYNRKNVIQMLEDTGLNILPLSDNPYGLVIVFNDKGRENAMRLWKFAISKGGYFQDSTPDEARFIGKMLEYTDTSIETYVNRIYDENSQRRKQSLNEDFDDNKYVAVVTPDMQLIKGTTHNAIFKQLFPDIEGYAEKYDHAFENGYVRVIWNENEYQGQPIIHASFEGNKANLIAALKRFYYKEIITNRSSVNIDIFETGKSLGFILPEQKQAFSAFMSGLTEDIEEGVGDKYVERKYHMQPEFDDFEQLYRNKLSTEGHDEVVYDDTNKGGTLRIIKNPKSLNSVGADVRGVIDREGNFYTEQRVSGKVHVAILGVLEDLDLIPEDWDWGEHLPTDFITVQRSKDENAILLSEKTEMMTPPEERDPEYYGAGYWESFPSYEEAYPEFQKFIDRAKAKNPSINFINANIVYYEGNGSKNIKEYNNFDNGVDGLENSSTFAAEIPVNTSTEMMTENKLMSLNDLPFKADVEAMGGSIHAVGGSVRDSFLGKDSKDLDVLITGVPLDDLERIVSKYGRVDSVGKSFGVLKFMPNGVDLDEPIDIAIPRTEKMTAGGGHKDFDVTSDHTLPIERDLERRDITINAIAKDANGNIIDPYGGQEDLKNKIIRAVNPQAFSDDPLRMLRCVGFASRFGFTIEPTTMKMIQDTADRISGIATERLLIEFDKIIKKGNIRLGVQLLKDTGLFKHIFGFDIQQSTIDRSPFEEVRTMGEFLYLLIRLSPNPAEFYLGKFATEDAKRDKIYKEIKALDIGLSNQNDNPIALRSIAHNMYTIAPESLGSEILPEALEIAAQELLSGKYPKTVGELAVNGNDLLAAGLKGKEIGDAQRKMLLKIYSDKLPNDKDSLLALLGNNDLDEANLKKAAEMVRKYTVDEKKEDFDEGVGDKYAERKFGIPDAGAEFDTLYRQAKAVSGEKPVAYVNGFNTKTNAKEQSPIFLNPKSLNGFDNAVRAISDESGNLYVAQKNYGFTHGDISVALGFFRSNYQIFESYDRYTTYHRVDAMPAFGISPTNEQYLKKGNEEIVENLLNAARQKNPQYDFTTDYFEYVSGKYNDEVGVDEGVGDKYAEKRFGIPDAGAEFEKKYQQNRLVIDGNEPFGYVSDFIDWKGKTSPEKVPVYKNPKSLRDFDYNVRAISDTQGNLYVALVDEAFNHGEMAAHIGLMNGDDTIYERITDFLLLNRVKDKDVFGFADSSEEEYNQSNEDRKRVTELLNIVKRSNPQFKFIPKYYEEITGDLNVDESLDETIKGGKYIMYHGSNHAFNKFTDEFVGGESANDQEGAGIYFTTSKEEANRYGKYIYKVQLKPRKLTNIANKRFVSVSDMTKLIKMSPTWKDDVQNWDENIIRGLAIAIKSIMEYSDNEKDLFQQIEHDFFRYQPRLYVQGMTKLGYDGQLIDKDYEGIVHIIVYNPEIITILESNVENTEPINEEEMSNIAYSAVVLDNVSHQKLVKVFKPMIPKDWEILAHHMTLNLGGIDPKFEQDLGRDIEISVVDYAMDDKVMAVGVEGYPTNNKKAHITIAVNRTVGGKPMMSNDLSDWKPIEFPLQIDGTITEIER